MSEPIAVAFVEVRPETDSFKSNAEQGMLAGISDDVQIKGQLQIDGIDEVRREVSGLTDDLSQLSRPVRLEGVQEAVADTRQLRNETREAAREEERLARTRRSAGASDPFAISPLRVAGVVAGALAGSRALSDLSEALKVTGNDAASTGGQLRNFAAGVLQGDVIGAFKALTNETYTYSAAQLQLINQTPELEEGLRALGHGADIARSRLAELAKLSENPVPQFIQTQIAVAREQGDPAALRAALERASDSVDDALERAKALRPNQRALAREIGERREELAQVRHQIEQLQSAGTDTSSFPVSPATRQRADLLAGLEAREKQLQDDLTGFVQRRNENLPAFNAAREALANAKRQQKEAIQQAVRAEAEDVLAPLAEAVTDARITGSATRILAALRSEAAGLRQVIDGFEGSAADRKTFKDRLVATNQSIESTQREIVAEQERHRQAMIDNRLAPSEEAIIDATLADASTVPARQARIAQIESILATGMINGKKVSRDQRVALKNEIITQNAAIESEQNAITAENERHARAMQQKLDDADRSFLAALGGREQALRNQQTIEQGRAGLQGDIRVSNELQRFFTESIRLARQTIHDKQQRDETVASLRGEQSREAQNERGLRAQQRSEIADRQTERADLAIELAQTTGNRAAEVRAHNAKIALLRERIANTGRRSVERARLRVEIARERADIAKLRDDTGLERADIAIELAQTSQNKAAEIKAHEAKIGLLRERLANTRKNSIERARLRLAIARERADIKRLREEEETTSGTTLADLFTQQVQINRDRSIGQPLLAPKIGDVTQPIEDRVQRQLRAQADVTVKSPFERTGDKVATSNEKLTVAIERLTSVIGGGGTVAPRPELSPSGAAGARGEAAARFWQSRRGKQLAQETASA